MKCNKCNGTKIKSRTNYNFGKKSSSITTLSCKKCGSTDVSSSSPSYGKKRRR